MFNALQRGKILKDPVFWKRLQLGLNASLPLIPIIITIAPETAVFITPEAITGLATIVGVVNSYLTIATTERLGL
jgi:hypothetical protein